MRARLTIAVCWMAALLGGCSGGGGSGRPEPIYECGDRVVRLVEQRTSSPAKVGAVWDFCLAAMDRIESLGPEAEGYFARFELDIMDALDAAERESWALAERAARAIESFD